MNAVGIDVSKGRSTVTIRQPGDVVILPPRDYRHTQSSINDLIATIKELDGETKVCMEHTGRYYEPVASWLSAAGIVDTPENQQSSAGKMARGRVVVLGGRQPACVLRLAMRYFSSPPFCCFSSVSTISSSARSTLASSSPLATNRSELPRRTRPMRRKSLVLRLTAGQNCGSIVVWTNYETN